MANFISLRVLQKIWRLKNYTHSQIIRALHCRNFRTQWNWTRSWFIKISARMCSCLFCHLYINNTKLTIQYFRTFLIKIIFDWNKMFACKHCKWYTIAWSKQMFNKWSVRFSTNCYIIEENNFSIVF